METSPALELAPILERCRAHDIACPMDLVTARVISPRTLAWIEYVNALPLDTPREHPIQDQPVSHAFVWLTVAGATAAVILVAWLALYRPSPSAQAPPTDTSGAFAFLAQHKPDRAADIFRTLLAKDPQRADAHYGLARVYWEQGREDDALAEAQAALRQRENDPVTWLMLAKAAHGSGHLTFARQAYARALALEPRHPRAEEIRSALRGLDGQ